MRSTEVAPASTIQTGLKIKLSAPRTTNKWWQESGPWAWDEMIQQFKLLRSRITGGNAGFPTHYQPIRLSRNIEIGRTCTERKTIFKTSNTETQIMEAKYFCILAYISMRLITMGLSHRQKMWPGRAIHRWTNQPGLIEGRSCSSALEILQTVDLSKMAICWFIYARGQTPPCLTNSTLKHNNLKAACNIKDSSCRFK